MNTRIKSGKSFFNEHYPQSPKADVIYKLCGGITGDFTEEQLLKMHSSVLYLTEFVYRLSWDDLTDEEIRSYIKLFMFELFNDFEDSETMTVLYKERFESLKFGTNEMQSLKSNALYDFHFSEFVGFFFSWLHSNASHIDFQSTFNDFINTPLMYCLTDEEIRSYIKQDESHSLESQSFAAGGKSKSKEDSLC